MRVSSLLQKFIVAALCIAFLCGFRGGLTSIAGLPNTAGTPLNLGGGGNISGQSISPTGVRLIRGDVFGAYIFGTDNIWHLINGENNMCPGGSYLAGTCPYFGFYPPNTSANQFYVGFTGVEEIVGCPSSASCAYMYGGGWVFYSNNISTSNPGSISWCATTFIKTADLSNSAVGTNNPGPFVAVDPNNPDHVLVAAPTVGVFESFNATLACSAPGTDTWTAISTSSIPQSTSYPGYNVAFDPTSPTATCHSGSGTCTSTAYIWTNGATAGVYASFNAGSTWSLTSSGPATVQHLKVSAATAGGGNLWATDVGRNLWEYSNSSGTPCSTGLGTCSWVEITSGLAHALDVAINPFNGDQIAVADGTSIFTSTNGSSSAPTFVSRAGSSAPGDTPWVATIQAGTQFFGVKGLDFDPLNNGLLLGHGSQWEWTTTFPTSSFTLAALSSGIQGAVSFSNIEVATSQTPTFGYEDITGCTFSISTSATPPSGCALPGQGPNGLYQITGLSIAPGTTFMASKGDADMAAGFSLAGYTTDGFKTTYLPYNSWNASVASATGVTSGTGGVVRLNVGSTTALNSFSPGQTLSSNSIVCVVSNLFTSGLTQLCYPINVIDGSHIDLIGSTFNSGLMTTAGFTYTAYVPANLLDEWFGGGVVQNVTSTAGVVTVTYQNAAGGNTVAHSQVCISGVVMTGATVVNGCWVAINPSGSTVQLQGSTFAGGDTYSTGGTVLSTMAPGGNLAAATPTNFAMYGGDRTLPFCTTNAGATWNPIGIAGVPAVATTVTGGPYSAGATSITVASGAALTVQPQKLVILLSSGRYFEETGSTISGSTITLKTAIPLGDSLATGAAVYNGTATGGPPAAFFRTQQMAADKVTPNTFYYLNAQVGLVKWTNCGSTTIVTPGTPNTGFLSNSGNNDQIKTVPGQPGHLFYTAGSVTGAAPQPVTDSLWRTCNGVNSTAGSVTLSSVPGFFEALAVGFGAAAPGKSYPSIYVAGWYSATNTRSSAVYGIWRSIDDANNGATGSCATGNTWAEVTGTGGFVAGFPAKPVDIEGDPFIYGPYYTSGAFGQFYQVQN